LIGSTKIYRTLKKSASIFNALTDINIVLSRPASGFCPDFLDSEHGFSLRSRYFRLKRVRVPIVPPRSGDRVRFFESEPFRNGTLSYFPVRFLENRREDGRRYPFPTVDPFIVGRIVRMPRGL
jgi:hypothetical protein